MNRNQWIAILCAVVLVVGIYLFADTYQPKPVGTKPPMGAATRDKEKPSFDIEGYIARVKSNITSKDTLALLNNLGKDATIPNLEKLVAIYHKLGESVLEAEYTDKLATQKHDVKLMARAGDLFGATSAISNDENMHHYLMDQAVESYKNAVSVDTNNTELRIKLASAYMDQGTAPMQGVSILLDIVKRDSANADALMMLGKFGIVSGQYDKAIARLEKVVSLRPRNYDALFLLAEAYRGKGDKQRAVELLRSCLKLIDKPELKKEIEDYILKIQSNS